MAKKKKKKVHNAEKVVFETIEVPTEEEIKVSKSTEEKEIEEYFEDSGQLEEVGKEVVIDSVEGNQELKTDEDVVLEQVTEDVTSVEKETEEVLTEDEKVEIVNERIDGIIDSMEEREKEIIRKTRNKTIIYCIVCFIAFTLFITEFNNRKPKAIEVDENANQQEVVIEDNKETTLVSEESYDTESSYYLDKETNHLMLEVVLPKTSENTLKGRILVHVEGDIPDAEVEKGKDTTATSIVEPTKLSKEITLTKKDTLYKLDVDVNEYIDKYAKVGETTDLYFTIELEHKEYKNYSIEGVITLPAKVNDTDTNTTGTDGVV